MTYTLKFHKGWKVESIKIDNDKLVRMTKIKQNADLKTICLELNLRHI